MTLKKFMRQYRTIVVSAAMLLGSVIGIVFGVVPLGQQVLTLFGERTALLTQVNALATKATILESQDEETLRRDIGILASAIPSDKSLATLLSGVDAVASPIGLPIRDLTIARPGSLASDSAKKQTPDERAVGANILPFSLVLDGTYEQVQTFISKVGAIRRLFRVRGLDMVFMKSGNVTARVAMDAFYMPFPTQLGSAEQQVSALTDTEGQIIANLESLPIAAASVESEGTPTGAEGQTPSGAGGKLNPFSP